MAIDFATSQYYTGAFIPVTAYPFTMSVWARPRNSLNRNILTLGSTTGTSRIALRYLNTYAASMLVDNAGSQTATTTTATSAVNTWAHLSAVFASAANRSVYLDGGGKTTSTTSRPFNAAIDVTGVGVAIVSGSVNQAANITSVAEAAIWSEALTDDEIATLATGIRPSLVRPDKLVFYVPGIRDVIDFSRGGALTPNGTPTLFPHVRRIA
jgi:hypothetical protein